MLRGAYPYIRIMYIMLNRCMANRRFGCVTRVSGLTDGPPPTLRYAGVSGGLLSVFRRLLSASSSA